MSSIEGSEPMQGTEEGATVGQPRMREMNWLEGEPCILHHPTLPLTILVAIIGSLGSL